jgi:predicted RecA/RadA family phage recombinase
MGPFEWKDNVIYDELLDVLTATAVDKGDGVVQQDVFGFWVTDLAAGKTGNLIYRCRQVRANKRVGTGEAIIAGDRLYYIPAEDIVTPNAGTTPGTNSYFCGTAKKDASESELTVLMNFDGTMYDQNI